MRVLLVGGGGREHALAWKLAQSPLLSELHAVPGNPGISALATCHEGEPAEVARRVCPDLVVIGPEAPLVAGLADELRAEGIAVFGPGREAARIEGSKRFAKEVMDAAGVPSAALLDRPRAPAVVKEDGLAAGKGVQVCTTDDELRSALSAAGPDAFVEELLEGEELSVFALVAGDQVVPLASARDFKRIGDGDTGPNTGGMGAFSPVPGAPELDELVDLVHRPVAAELAGRGIPFNGLLYAGLMLTADGVRVLEFNCRFGDPETQAVLPRLEGDLLAALAATAHGAPASIAAGDDAAVTVVLAARDYPDHGDRGTPIAGVEEAGLVFHAGTAVEGGRLVTAGGRVLAVTGVGPTLEAARDEAYANLGRVHFDGCRFRSDIAARVHAVA